MHHRTPRALAAAAALALTLGACSDVPTTSSLTARYAPPAHTASGSGITLIPNGTKYRDNGGKSAKGRSGSAELEALALLARDGTTTLHAQARSVDPSVTDTGEVSKLQIKATAPDGSLKFVRNLNGDSSSEPLELGGLARGDRVQLQANVRGLDGNRTDVVTVTETVKRRADLGIRLSTPERATVGAQVVIWATVTEHNGDMGSRADCELLIDGQPADRAGGIWVDAGDAVTCGFTHVFAQAGTYALTARVLPPEGGDWDDTNNADAGSVQVDATAPGDNRFRAHVSVREDTYYDSTTYTYAWRSPWEGTATEGISRFLTRSDYRFTDMYAWLPRAIAGPVRVELSQESGGRVMHSTALSSEASGFDWCVSSYEGPVGLYVCSASYGRVDGAGTDISYYVFDFGGGAIYHSDEYSRVWDERTGEDVAVYHTVTAEGYWTPQPPLGDTYTWRVRVIAPDGEYVADETQQVVRRRIDRSIPHHCWELDDYFQVGTMCMATHAYSEEAYGY